MRCDACGQEVGECAPACPYHGVVFIDDFLTRQRQKLGHPALRAALTPGAEKSPIMLIFNLETYRKKKKDRMSKMSDLHLLIQQLIDHELEKQGSPIKWDSTARSLFQAVERLKEEMAKQHIPMPHGEAIHAVMTVLSGRLQDHLENGVPPRGNHDKT